MKMYQVLNSHGYAAGDEFDSQAIYPNMESAKRQVKYLKETCLTEDEYAIQEVEVNIPFEPCPGAGDSPLSSKNQK